MFSVMINLSQKISAIPSYAFAENDRIATELRSRGVDVIDFGTGDPLDETPQFVRKAAKDAIDVHKSSGYPSYIGSAAFRFGIADWFRRRFGVELDPETEITSTIGSKEAIFSFPQAFINPGDFVIMPSPGYPPYSRGTIFASGTPYFYPLLEGNNFYPDFSAIPRDVVMKSKIMWICYPNSPTSKMASEDFLREAIAFCRKNNIILASDECYADIYFGRKAMSVLEMGKEGIVAFYSLSKRNNMTGYRVGFACGDRRIISAIKKLKTNMDSGTPDFVQAAAIAALKDDSHVESMRNKYRRRRNILLGALRKCGFQVRQTEGTFYIWQRVPKGYDSISFSRRLLEEDCGIVVTPGTWISDKTQDGIDPGENYVRFALVEPEDRVSAAAERLRKITF